MIDSFRTDWLRLALLVSLSLHYGCADSGLTAQQRQWLESDELDTPASVNEGQLKFLSTPPDKIIPHSDNKFSIDKNSLEHGWVSLQQCHYHLDAVPDLEVVYQYKQMQDLKIISAKKIGSAYVKHNSVQIQDIAHNASLCISARVRVLYRDNNRYSLVNGPYHRKFLDGYFPYHVSIHVNYPPNLLRVDSVTPPPQPGVVITDKKGSLGLDAYFEGKLVTDIRFTRP